MGHIASECAQRRSARPDGLADFRILELPLRVFRQRQPETVLVGTGRHIVYEAIVRVGDPEGRHRVVRRQQNVLAVEAHFPIGLTIRIVGVSLSVGGGIRGHAFQCRMTLGLDCQVFDEFITVLDPVFEEEAVTDSVVGHVVLHVQEVRAMHGHTAVVGVVERRVLDVLPLGIADQMPVDRIPGKSHVLAHAIELDALDKHLASGHRHDVPAVEGLFRVGRCLKFDIACQQADFAAFIDVEGDLAEVHVVELLVERDRVSADCRNVAPFCLPGIEIRGCENDLVAGAPAGSVQELDRGGAGVRCAGQLRPGIGPVTVKIEGSAHEQDPAVHAVRRSTHSTDVFVFDVVGEGDGRLARVRSLFSADLQFPVQHDPLGGQFNVLIVREAEFAVDGHAVQRRRSDVENYLLVFLDDDLVACDGHLAVGPGRRIRPVRRLGCRRCRTLGLHDSEHADEQRC